MASIQVAVRCRHFSCNDNLGVTLKQLGPTEGEICLINSKYSTNRFGFSWAWWSAFNYKNRCKSNMEEADEMKYIGQDDVYQSLGMAIKKDLYAGCAVVIFAYGLSGSGKTFTVFGPDAADAPEAWFKQPTPTDYWGILPNLAYQLMQDRTDGWKITMKYFQNVVDIVRDLMSPTGEERSYKSGMRKVDGFQDITWCKSLALESWDHLRAEFQRANKKKAIAPTQFNPMSTRGHCIMLLEVEKPSADNPELKDKGRLYVCDLAGTEPAGDVFYATYTKTKDPATGKVEYLDPKPHNDLKKTKELQDQGKKINLSLSEMAQFFMKMAQAIKKKKLKPGKSIPGCNSYFLCKYLKDTMLSAKTYLVCGIRPEVKFLNYTFSTLKFADDASVIKLEPKKATVKMTPREKAMMKQMEEMKAMIAGLQSGGGGGGGGGGASQEELEAHKAKEAEYKAKLDALDSMSDEEKAAFETEKAEFEAAQAEWAAKESSLQQMEEMLMKKQAEIAAAMSGIGGTQSGPDQEALKQKTQYESRGMALSWAEEECTEPYFVNIDEDPFRSKRFMFIFREGSGVTTIGKQADANIRPFAISTKVNHCCVKREGDVLTLIGGEGEVFHNGCAVTVGQEVALAVFDRIAIGGGSMLLLWKDHGEGEEPDSDAILIEYENAARSSNNGGNDAALQAKMAAFEAAKLEWEAKMQSGTATKEDEDNQAVKIKEHLMAQMEEELRDLVPKAKEANTLATSLGRGYLMFEVKLQQESIKSEVPKVKVIVTNQQNDTSIVIDTFEFIKGYSIMKDEYRRLMQAVEFEEDYSVPPIADPATCFFDNTFHLGTGFVFPEFMVYGFPTDDGESNVSVKHPQTQRTIAQLEILWTPLASEDQDEDDDVDPDDLMFDIEEPEDLIGQEWCYRVNIKQASGMPFPIDRGFVQYDFFGETFTTETLEFGGETGEAPTSSPKFEYSMVHHIPAVTAEFLEWLKNPMEFFVRR